MREIDGILYCNDGDWVESLTALIEHADGRLEIADWSAQRTVSRRAAASPVPAGRGSAEGLPEFADPPGVGPATARG